MQNPDAISRRSLLQQSSLLGAGASALSILQPRAARAAGNDRLKAGLVGCGGRGTQAVVDLLTGNEHVGPGRHRGCLRRPPGTVARPAARPQVHRPLRRHRRGARRPAEGDDGRGPGGLHPAAHQRRAGSSFRGLRRLPEAARLRRRYRDAVHAARLPAAAFRSRRSTPASTSSPRSPSPPIPVGARRFIAAGKLAAERKLTVVSGAQRRAQREYVETVQKIQDGAIGEIAALYAVLPQRPGLSRRPARPQVGRHGVAAPQLVFLHLDLRRPDRGAAFPQSSIS